MTSNVTYFEISGPDAEGLHKFYGETLGMALAADDDGYAMADAGEGGITGGVFDGSSAWGSYAIPYIQVEDLEATVERAKAAGAEVLVPPTDHGPSRMAHLRDPAGNRVGVYILLT